MLKFDERFFEDEERDGFLVVSEMKRCWAAELNVLHEIDMVCKRHHIRWNAEFGTLLGAVRHHGFVPWDDDMDIGVLRPDYIRLMQVLPKELPKEFVVNSAYTSQDLSQPLGCVTNRAAVTVDPRDLAKSYGSPYIVGVDIYPLDYVPRDPELCALQRSLYNVVYDAAQQYEHYVETGEINEYLPAIEELLNTKIDRNGNVRSELWKLAEQVASMFKEDESDWVTWMPHRVLWEPEKVIEKSWYDTVTYVPFENIEVPIPNGYDEILTTHYQDYRTPRQVNIAHSYPFYKTQKQWMEEHGLCLP